MRVRERERDPADVIKVIETTVLIVLLLTDWWFEETV